MEPMSEEKRYMSLMLLLIITMIAGLAYHDLSLNERMALQGYAPFRLAGSTEVYWGKIPDQRRAADASEAHKAF